eukprot:PhM_4_TR3748/c1_g1_i2/m.55911
MSVPPHHSSGPSTAFRFFLVLAFSAVLFTMYLLQSQSRTSLYDHNDRLQRVHRAVQQDMHALKNSLNKKISALETENKKLREAWGQMSNELAAAQQQQQQQQQTPLAPTTQPPRRRRVAILTMNVAFGRDWIYPMSFRNKLAYAQHHGYDFIVEGPELVERSRDVCWSKIPMLQRWLPHYDWVMWIDGDAFFSNFDITLESIVSRFGEFAHSDRSDVPLKDFIVAKDFNGINLGVFFIRNSEYSFSLLETMWTTPRSKWHPWQEQSALMALLNDADTTRVHTPHFSFPAQRAFNSYPGEFAYGNKLSQWQKGDFIAHFPNCGNIASCQKTISRMYEKRTFKRVDEDTLAMVPATQYPVWWQRNKKKYETSQFNVANCA